MPPLLKLIQAPGGRSMESVNRLRSLSRLASDSPKPSVDTSPIVTGPPIGPDGGYDSRGGEMMLGHMSPHKFDQPSLDHLGIGEGNQAFTNGLYGWQSPYVGDWYEKGFERRINNGDVEHPDAKKWSDKNFLKSEWHDHRQFLETGIPQRLARELLNYHPGISSVAHKQLGMLDNDDPRFGTSWMRSHIHTSPEDAAMLRSLMESGNKHDYLVALHSVLAKDPILGRELGPGSSETPQEWASDAMMRIHDRDILSAPLPPSQPDPGDIGEAPEYKPGPVFQYQMRYKAHPDDLPDFNAPAKKQPPRIRDALLDMFKEAGMEDTRSLPRSDGTDFQASGLRSDSTLEDLRDHLRSLDSAPKPSGNHHPALGWLESGLMDRGIPGIRYDDGFSRQKDAGRTQNVVMYDPSKIEILRRWPYAVGAPIAAGAAASGEQEQ